MAFLGPFLMNAAHVCISSSLNCTSSGVVTKSLTAGSFMPAVIFSNSFLCASITPLVKGRSSAWVTSSEKFPRKLAFGLCMKA